MKIVAIALVVVSLLYLPFIVPGSEGAKAHMAAVRKPGLVNLQPPETEVDSQKRNELSMELYRDIIITAIHPVIHKSLEAYYGRPVGYEFIEVKFINIVRIKGYRTFDFIVKVQVQPFLGNHQTIGLDNLTVGINASRVWLRSFEHIKDYELPPYLRNDKSVL